MALGELARMAGGPGSDGGDPLVCVDLGTGLGCDRTVAGPRGRRRPSRPRGMGHRPRRRTRSRWPRPTWPRWRRIDPDAAAPGHAGRRVLVRRTARRPGRPGRPGRVQPAVCGARTSTPTSTRRCATGSPSGPWWQPGDVGGVAGMADVEAVVAGADRWLRPGGCAGGRAGADPGRRGRRCRPPGRIHTGGDGPRPGRAAADAGGRASDRGTAVKIGRRAGRRLGAAGGGALADGAVVAVPTDTVYGLAVDPSQPEAVARLFALKGRPSDVPLPVLVAGPEQVALVAGQLEAAAARIWPTGSGPAADPGGAPPAGVHRRPGRTTGGPPDGRGPAGPTTRWSWRCASCSGPLAVTSANLHGAAPATTRPRWCRRSPGPTDPASSSTAGRATGSPPRWWSAGDRRRAACARGRSPWADLHGRRRPAGREAEASATGPGVDDAGPHRRHWRDAALASRPGASP